MHDVRGLKSCVASTLCIRSYKATTKHNKNKKIRKGNHQNDPTLCPFENFHEDVVTRFKPKVFRFKLKVFHKNKKYVNSSTNITDLLLYAV